MFDFIIKGNINMLKRRKHSPKEDMDLSKHQDDCNKVSLTISVSTLVYLSGILIGSLHTGQNDVSYMYNPGSDDNQQVLSTGIMGYLTGVLLCAAWYRCVRLEIQLFLMYCIFGVCHGILPWLKMYGSGESTVRCLESIAMGYTECCTFVYVLYLWSDDTLQRPMIQMINMVFVFGIITAPFLTGPVAPTDNQAGVPMPFQNEPASFSQWNHSVLNDTILMIVSDNTNPSVDQFDSLYLYTILGIFTVLISVMLLLSFIRVDGQQTATKLKENNKNKKTYMNLLSLETCSSCLLVLAVVVHIFLSYFCIAVTISLTATADWLTEPYKHSYNIKMVLTSVFIGSKAIGHIAAIPLSMMLSPTVHLYGCDAISGLAYTLMVMDSQWNICLFWVSISFLGFAVATILPSSLVWLSEQLDVSGSVTSALMVGGSTGYLAGTIAANYMIQYYTYLWTGYLCMFVSIINLILFAVVANLAAQYKEYMEEEKEERKPLLTGHVKMYTV